MSYFIEGQGKTDKANRMSGHMTIIPFPVLYQCPNANALKEQRQLRLM